MKSNAIIIILCLGIFGILGYLGYKKNFFKSNTLNSEVVSEGTVIRFPDVGYEKMCIKFRYIEFEFKGEYGEDLRIVTKCVLNKTELKLESFVIPFKHIFSFLPQSGEFTTEIDTKIYIKNHQKKWSKIWNLVNLRFFNSAADQFKVPDKKLVLNLKTMAQVSEK